MVPRSGIFGIWNCLASFSSVWFIMVVRASTAGVANVPNAKYLAHLPHQTPKIPFIRCVKSHKIYNMWTVPLQICNGTDENGKKKEEFFIHSLSSFFTFSLLSLSFSFFFLRHFISVTLFSSFLLPLFFFFLQKLHFRWTFLLLLCSMSQGVIVPKRLFF